MAEISRNLSRIPAAEQGVRHKGRLPRQNSNANEFPRENVRVIEQTDTMIARERYEAARLKADLLAQQLFEAKVQQSIAEEKLAAGMHVSAPDSEIPEEDTTIQPADSATKLINKRIEAMVEALTALQSDIPVRNEPLFVNVII